MATGRDQRCRHEPVRRPEQVEGENHASLEEVPRPSVVPVAEGAHDPRGTGTRLDVGAELEPAAERRDGVFRDRAAPDAVDGPEARRRRRRHHRDCTPDEAVVERQHLVAPRLGPPELDQGLHEFGMVGGEVVRLGEVVLEVEQCPVVLVEVVAPRHQVTLDTQLASDVVGGRLPSVVIERTASDHLEVLRRARAGSLGIVEGGDQGAALDRLLRHAVDDVGRTDAGRIEDRRHEVDGVTELRPDVVAETPVTLPWGFTIAVPSEMV